MEVSVSLVEAKVQMGLEMQHISDGVVYNDGIDNSKWVCCHGLKKNSLPLGMSYKCQRGKNQIALSMYL